MFVAAHPLHVDADDLHQVGQAGGVLVHGVEHLVDLLLVAADHELAVRVVHDVLQLRPRVGGVDADHNATDGLRRQVGEHPVGAVLAGNGQAVPLFESEGLQAVSEAASGLQIVLPGHPVPDAVILLAKR